MSDDACAVVARPLIVRSLAPSTIAWRVACRRTRQQRFQLRGEHVLSFREVSSILIAALLCVACGDDEPISVSITGTSGGDEIGEEEEEGEAEDEAEAEDGVDDTSADEGMSGTGGDDGSCSDYPLPFEQDDHFLFQRENEGDPVLVGPGDPPTSLDGETACPDTFAVTESVGNATAFYVYRLVDTTGTDDWPDAELPLAVFVKANGGVTVDDGDHVYGHVFDELATDGFVVVAIEGNHNTVGQRRNAVLCATEWARTTYAGRLNCDRVLLPGSTTCGTIEPLDLAYGADEDNDLESLRWEVDGALLAEAIDEIEINASHQIRAILRDARGATAVASHSISCTPP